MKEESIKIVESALELATRNGLFHMKGVAQVNTAWENIKRELYSPSQSIMDMEVNEPEVVNPPLRDTNTYVEDGKKVVEGKPKNIKYK